MLATVPTIAKTQFQAPADIRTSFAQCL